MTTNAWTVNVQDERGEMVTLTRWSADHEPEPVDSWTCVECCQPTQTGWVIYHGGGGLIIYCDECTADTFLAPDDDGADLPAIPTDLYD